MAETLKEKTAKGLFWGGLSGGMTQVLNVVIGILLGRMLSPDEWAPISMITIFSAIAGNLQSSGFSTAIVNMKQPTANDYNAVFWFNVSMGFVLYWLLFAAAPFIALFFEQPCLTDLSRLIFLAFFISSFGISTQAYLTKNMMQREIAIVNLSALMVSGTVAVTLALKGYSYWSLAWQQIVNSAVLVVGRFFFVKWRPSLKVDFTPIRQTYRFAMSILVTMVINTVNSNILTFIFGKLFTRTPATVGNFFQAFKWNTMAYQVVGGMLEQVAQPVLVETSPPALIPEQSSPNHSLSQGEGAENVERLRRVFRKMLRFTAFVSFPALLGLSMVSEEFILATIGAKWQGCVPLLRILCIGGAFMPFYSLYKNLVISQGRGALNMWLNVVQIVLQLLLILMTYREGIITVVWTYTVFNILWLCVWQLYAKRLIGIRLADILKDTLPFGCISLIIMVLTWWVTQPLTNVYGLLAARVVMAGLLYVGLMKLLRVRILDECINFILKRNKP